VGVLFKGEPQLLAFSPIKNGVENLGFVTLSTVQTSPRIVHGKEKT
jgi:hypothetical protein